MRAVEAAGAGEDRRVNHLRVEVANNGAKRIAVHDRLLVVDDDGNETDISCLVSSMKIALAYGSAATLDVSFLGFDVVQAPGDES